MSGIGSRIDMGRDGPDQRTRSAATKPTPAAIPTACSGVRRIAVTRLSHCSNGAPALGTSVAISESVVTVGAASRVGSGEFALTSEFPAPIMNGQRPAYRGNGSRRRSDVLVPAAFFQSCWKVSFESMSIFVSSHVGEAPRTEMSSKGSRKNSAILRGSGVTQISKRGASVPKRVGCAPASRGPTSDCSDPEGQGPPVSGQLWPELLRIPLTDVRFGSDAEDPSMSAARLLHPAQRTNARASPKVCLGPNPDCAPQQTVRLPNQLVGKRERLDGSSDALRLRRLRLMISSNLPRLTH